MEEGVTWEGKRSGGGRRKKKRRNYQPTWTACKSCMVAYEWYCMTMCTGIIVIVNLLAE